MVDGIDILLRHVGRRMRVARAGRGLLVGCAAAVAIAFAGAVLPSVFDLRWTIGLGIAAVAGSTLAAWMKGRQTPLSVARHVDDVRGLHELLSSAVATRTRDDDASRLVYAHALTVARTLSARDIPVDAASPRGAAAVGLAGVLALVAWQFRSAPDTQAPPPHSSVAVQIDAAPQRQENMSSGTRTPDVRDGDRTSNAAGPSASTGHDATARSSSPRPPTDSTDSDGTSAGTTPDAREVGEATFTPARDGASDAAASSSGQNVAARQDEHANPRTTSTASSARAPRESLSVPSREGPGAGDSRVADGQMPIDRVPAQARDVVRAFFDVPSTRPVRVARESDR